MDKIRTDVEKLYLKEMVLEDQQYTAIGECDAIDCIDGIDTEDVFNSDDEAIYYDDDDFEIEDENFW